VFCWTKGFKIIKINLSWLLVLLSGCCYHENSSHECAVEFKTFFGQKLLTNTHPMTNNRYVRVLGDCREIDESNAEKRNTLTSRKYNIPIKQAKKFELEDLQLDQTHKNLFTH
jgi:hypothetical protein